MVTNYKTPGKTVTITATAATASGAVVLAGALHGIAAGAAAIGDPLDVVTEGVFGISKVAAESFTVGDVVYFATGTSLATSTAGSNPKLGYAVAAAAAGGATVDVRLVPTV